MGIFKQIPQQTKDFSISRKQDKSSLLIKNTPKAQQKEI